MNIYLEGGSAGSSESMHKVIYEIKVTIGETPVFKIIIGFQWQKGTLLHQD